MMDAYKLFRCEHKLQTKLKTTFLLEEHIPDGVDTKREIQSLVKSRPVSRAAQS